MPEHRLTRREFDIMGALWELGEGTVYEIRSRVDKTLAYTTISSMVRLLELKGYVAHRRGEGKTNVYYPMIDAETAGASALRRLLEKVYRGSPIKLLAHLVEQRRLSESELARMRAVLKGRPRGRAKR